MLLNQTRFENVIHPIVGTLNISYLLNSQWVASLKWSELGIAQPQRVLFSLLGRVHKKIDYYKEIFCQGSNPLQKIQNK